MRIRTIARAHLLSGQAMPDRDPTVTRTLRMIERMTRDRGGRAALFRAADFTGEESASTTKARSHAARNTTRRRSLRATPRLVSRRPKGN